MSIALQVGLFRLIRNQWTKSLSFWYGFEAFGMVAAIITIYSDIFSPSDSGIFDIWDLYLFNTVNLIEKSLRILISVTVHSLGLSFANDGIILPAWHGRPRFQNPCGRRLRQKSKRRFLRWWSSTNSVLPSWKHASTISRTGSNSTPPTRRSRHPLIRSE